MAVAVTPSVGDQSAVASQNAGDKGCCTVVGMGNVDGSSDGLVTMGDLTVLIDNLFISLAPLACPEAGNVDLSTDGLVTMGDLTVLIDHLFISLSPLPECPVIDIDGNVYRTVRIGSQVWMAENLRVTHYANGDAIPNVTNGAAWAGLTNGAYCDYDNDVNNAATYGRLYNFYTVDIHFHYIAPNGWHVPDDDEWQELVDYLGGGSVAGGKLKEAGTTHWFSPNTGATNESGFCALPGGFRQDGGGAFLSIGYYTAFWSSSWGGTVYAWVRDMDSESSEIYRGRLPWHKGLSVRCVRDY
jgi:uncharacterized protein (TIGR02145 family)